jgi:hypothetical protein
MDPQVIGADQWDQISHALIYLFLFTGLGLTSAIAFLLGHAVLPSLAQSGDTARVVSALRWMAYPVSLAALVLAAYALARGLVLATAVTQQIYPRSWI